MTTIVNKIWFKLMRFLVSSSAEKPFVKFYQSKIGKNTVYEGNSLLVDRAREDKNIQELRENGFTELPYKLDDRAINEILSFLGNQKCHDPYRPQFGHFKIEDVPAETHTAHYEREDLVKCPLIMQLANDPGVLEIAQGFLGARPTISNVNIWWSFGGKKIAEEAQNFHRDVDDFKFCKLFVYLTDVTQNSGPHVYVKSTSQSPKLKKIRRYSDAEVIDAFGKENIIEFVRPKGSCFFVDTYGFHKGLLPKTGKRLLLQFQYSLNPILIENYKPEKVHSSYNKYINRLLVK